MVQHEGEAGDLAGELEKKEGFEGLVGKEALSALTQMQNLLTSIGATITSVLGPPLNWLMGMVTDVIEGTQSPLGRLYNLIPFVSFFVSSSSPK